MISALERGSLQNAKIATWVVTWVVPSGPTFSTAIGASEMTVQHIVLEKFRGHAPNFLHGP